jgi:ribosomal protein L37AE/L43A
MTDSESEQYAQLQEILDEIVAGRTDGHACPFCGQGPLKVPRLDEGGVRLECPGCRRFFDGQFR